MKVKVILILLISFWVIQSFFNVFYNSVKPVGEIKEWGFLSTEEKKYKIFGSLHDFLTNLRENTPSDSNIIIVSDDARIYYLSIYYLYPRKISHLKYSSSIDPKGLPGFDFLAVQDFSKLNNPIINSELKLIYNAKSGSLYKIK